MLKTIWLGTYGALAQKLQCVSGYWDCPTPGQRIFKAQNTTLTFFTGTGIVWCHGLLEKTLIDIITRKPS